MDDIPGRLVLEVGKSLASFAGAGGKRIAHFEELATLWQRVSRDDGTRRLSWRFTSDPRDRRPGAFLRQGLKIT
jgi:hypothetical protein